MRSHAKAPSAGSISDQGESHRSFSRPGTLAAVALALVAACCLLPGSALAGETRLPVESFGADGTEASIFEFSNALAFDQGSERLYVLDQALASIDGFDASTPGAHIPLGGNFPLAAPASEPGLVDDLAVDQASHHIVFSSQGKAFSAEPSLFAFDSGGTELGGNFPLGGFAEPCGATVDASGNIWVADYVTKTVKTYDSAGNPAFVSLNGFVDTSTEGHPCHLALDSEDNLYVSMYQGPVWKYSHTSSYQEASQVDPIAAGGFSVPASPIAVDRSTNDLYVAHIDHVSVFAPGGALISEFGSTIAGAEYNGIAIDQAGEEVYVSDFAHQKVQVFGPPIPLPDVTSEDADAVTTTLATLHGRVNPEGEQLTDCHFELVPASQFSVDGYASLTPAEEAPCVPVAASIAPDSSDHAVSAEISGLSPDTTYHFRLVAATAEGSVNGADRTLITAVSAPTVSESSVEAVGNTDAILSAKVNPKGAKATYHVEYGTTVAYGQSTPESAPIGFGGDDSNHTVSVHIGGLQAGTAYHFRFVATSLAGTGEGDDTSFATYPTAPPVSGSCPNDQYRSGLGARLPDCRAYEQATPTDKHGANVQGRRGLIEASGSGDRVTFYLNGGLPAASGTSFLSAYVASRGAAGWGSYGLLPATAPGLDARVLGWSEDLTAAAAIAPGPGNVGSALYLSDGDAAHYQLVASGITESFLAGFAAEPSHLIAESNASLLPGVPTANLKLYDYDHGTLTLVGRIPPGSATSCDDAGAPACVIPAKGSFAGPSDEAGGVRGANYTHSAISRDGSRVFFGSFETNQLYLREDATRTLQVSASQATVPDPNGHKPANFRAATPDGATVFFSSCEKLTDDSTAVSTPSGNCTTGPQNYPAGQDLYSYDTDSGELTDLTVDSDAGDLQGADVQGVLGVSEDGSYVYFAAGGVLAPGAAPANCLVFGGSCNLYVAHDGTTSFIARVAANDEKDWTQSQYLGQPKTARVAADGSAVLFSSRESLTGYPSGDKAELYRYTPAGEELACISCNPANTPAVGDAVLDTFRSAGAFVQSPYTYFLTRNLSADGERAFFDSPDALLASDTNGVTDVYEWEAKGSGSCETESQNGGCLYLLSSGTSPDPSYFGDASTDGSHVFLFTSQQLVPSDHDELIDIYDAGVGAGLAAQHALAPPTCTGTACQANPPPPPDQTMSSASFSGPGNARERSNARKCPKGKRKVRRAGKVSCQKAHKQHKRHSNRGGSK